LISEGRTYATLSAILAAVSVVCWIVFARATSQDFETFCGDGCLLPLNPGVRVGLWLGAATMLTVFSAAAAVASALLHAAARHLPDR
jgi:hypothetical protein